MGIKTSSRPESRTLVVVERIMSFVVTEAREGADVA
jgi:hypothetical protein